MQTSSDNGKTVAIISYITFIGWIIALLMNNNNRTVLGSFHVRQSLGIICVGAVLVILSGLFGFGYITRIIQIAVFVFWIIGLIGAAQGEMKTVPLLGEKFQEWFKGI